MHLKESVKAIIVICVSSFWVGGKKDSKEEDGIIKKTNSGVAE